MAIAEARQRCPNLVLVSGYVLCLWRHLLQIEKAS